MLLYTATGTHHLFSAIIACFVASLVLTIPKGIEELLYSAAIIALMLQLAVWGHRFRWVDIRYQQSRETHPDSVSSIHILGLSARIILYAFYYP